MSPARRASAVFLCAFAYLAWLAASRYVFFMNDEGIYLDGALRVLHGQMPYRDFFAISGPGTFALLAASFRVFGTTLMAARIPVLWDIAIITACLFWLVCKLGDSKLSNSTAAALTAFVYLPFATLAETAVVANHRWDSSAWAILGGTLLLAAVENRAEQNPATRSFLLSFAAGSAAGLAAWFTPPVALAAVALGACLILYRTTRRLFPAYASGVAVMFSAGAFWIVSTGTLPAMLNSFRWTAANYSSANRTGYAAVPGGYANLLNSSSLSQAAATILVVAFFILPAALPFFSAVWLWKRPSVSVVILLTLGVALVFSTYPRWDVNHLTWVSAPFYALTAVWIAGWSSRKLVRFRKAVALIALLAGSSCFAVTIHSRLGETTRVTNLGTIHGRPSDLDLLETIQARVTPSDTLFVFPYRPLLYFVTGAHNPTQYSFLQPGMFPDQDEAQALRQLNAHPPRWVLYAHVSTETYLLLWPNSDPRRLRMPRIETFLGENYRGREQWEDLQLLELRDGGSVARADAH